MKAVLSNSVSVYFLIRKTRLLKNGEAPICMRVAVGKQMFEWVTKRSIPIELWNQQKECSKGKDREAKELNQYLKDLETKFFEIQRRLELENIPITLDAVKERFLGKKEKTICEVYRQHNEICKGLIGKEYTAGTVMKFNTSLTYLIQYMQFQYNQDDKILSEVDAEFIRGFEFFLKTQKDCKVNTSTKYLKNLKKIVRIAIGNGWIKKDPFYGIHFKHERVHVEFLSKDELERIVQKEFSIPRLELVKDIFVFCSFTGLAFVDVEHLTPYHLVEDNKGSLWIRLSRQKTKEMCNIPLLSTAKEILKKYEDHPECIKKGVLLPVLSNQKMNAYLKEIADICNINKRLTTHVARHTAATVVFLANKVSLENVAKILGHSSTRMTEHYAKVLDDSIMRDMEGVEKAFLKSE